MFCLNKYGLSSLLMSAQTVKNLNEMHILLTLVFESLWTFFPQFYPLKSFFLNIIYHLLLPHFSKPSMTNPGALKRPPGFYGALCLIASVRENYSTCGMQGHVMLWPPDSVHWPAVSLVYDNECKLYTCMDVTVEQLITHLKTIHKMDNCRINMLAFFKYHSYF